MLLTHSFEPVYDNNSRILILGTFPSVKSRENEFYYGHPQNRFWRVLAALFGCAVPQTIEQKQRLLLQNRVALWDVVHSCEIQGSSDSSIRNVTANDMDGILQSCQIQRIYANGGTAAKLYRRYILPQTGREAATLPSTSPANAAFSLDRLVSEWSVILEALK